MPLSNLYSESPMISIWNSEDIKLWLMKHVVLDIFYSGLSYKACSDSGFTNLSFYWGAISTIGSAHAYYKLFRAVCA